MAEQLMFLPSWVPMYARMQIQRMKVEVEQQSSDLETVKRTWLEPLRELVSSVNEKFSCYFSQMKCAGQVKLKEHDSVRRRTVCCVHCQEVYT